MAFGLTAQGFKRKRQADIITELQATARETFGASINLQPSSIFSQLIGIFSERESLLWELAEGVYNARYPDTAEGVQLDNIASISGVVRLDSQPSRIKGVTCKGDVGTIVEIGKVFSVNGNSLARFKTETAALLVAGQDQIQKIEFDSVPDAGNFKLSFRGNETFDIPFNATAQDIQDELNDLPYLSEVIVTGNFTAGFEILFQGSDGKIIHDLLVEVDNTLTISASPIVITIAIDTQAIPQGLVDVVAESDGPTDAPIYSLTEIETPVPGLDSVINTQDVILGRSEETDSEYRIRRIQSLQRAGSGTVEAIRARLLEVQEVEEVVVFENITLVTDINGLPGKSFLAFVQGGDEQEIADNIWLNKPAGIETYGAITKTVVDSQGVNQTIKFSRPIEIPIYIKVQITKDTSPSSEWPANGAALVAQAMIDFVGALTIGQDLIVYPKLISALNSIPGIEDVLFGVGIAPNPTLGDDDNIVIAVNEKAIIADSVDVIVTVIP